MHSILCKAQILHFTRPVLIIRNAKLKISEAGAHCGGSSCPLSLSSYDLMIKGQAGVIISLLALLREGAIRAKWRETLFQAWWQV